MRHSYLEDVQINHGNTVFLSEWKYPHLCCFDTLSVPQQMSHSSVPCKQSCKRGTQYWNTERFISQGSDLQSLQDFEEKKKKKGDQDTLSKIDYWTVIANNFCPSCTLLSKTRQEETEVISCWSTIEKSKSNAAAISLMLPQQLQGSMRIQWQDGREMFKVS